MKKITQDRIRALPMEDVVADEVIKRIELINADTDAEVVLATVNSSFDEKITEAFANGLAGDKAGAAGRWIAHKLNVALEVLQASTESGPVTPGVKASFNSAVTMVDDEELNVQIEAYDEGVAGNSISIVGDGVTDIDQLVVDWNTAHPSAGAGLISVEGGDVGVVPADGFIMNLSGGVDPSEGPNEDLEKAQEKLGIDKMSDETKDCLNHAMAAEEPGDDFAAELQKMVDKLQQL